MGRGKTIPDDTRRKILSFRKRLSAAEIAESFDVSVHTVYDIFKKGLPARRTRVVWDEPPVIPDRKKEIVRPKGEYSNVIFVERQREEYLKKLCD